MRLVVLLPLLAGAAVAAQAATARAAEDRYGPRSARVEAQVQTQAQAQVQARAARAYDGPMLGWAGKAAPRAPEQLQPAAAQRPAAPRPMAAWAGYGAPPSPPPQRISLPQAPLPQSAPPQSALPQSALPQAAPPRSALPQAAPPRRVSAPPAPAQTFAPPPAPVRPRAYAPEPLAGGLPTSLYSPPVKAAPIAAAAPAPAPPAPPVRMAAPSAAPAAAPSAAPGAPSAAPQRAAPLAWNQRPSHLQALAEEQAHAVAASGDARPAGGLAPRTYSVGRMFGLTPDRIAPPGPDNTVLLAVDPAAQASAPADLADEPDHGSAEWLAQAAREAGRTTKKRAAQGAETKDLERAT